MTRIFKFLEWVLYSYFFLLNITIYTILLYTMRLNSLFAVSFIPHMYQKHLFYWFYFSSGWIYGYIIPEELLKTRPLSYKPNARNSNLFSSWFGYKEGRCRWSFYGLVESHYFWNWWFTAFVYYFLSLSLCNVTSIPIHIH